MYIDLACTTILCSKTNRTMFCIEMYIVLPHDHYLCSLCCFAAEIQVFLVLAAILNMYLWPLQEIRIFNETHPFIIHSLSFECNLPVLCTVFLLRVLKSNVMADGVVYFP